MGGGRGRGRRWDTDERGIGVGDARAWGPTIGRLAELAAAEGWVAESPEAHLLPHLEAAVAGTALTVRETSIEADGTFVVTLDWTAEDPPSRRALRRALFGLVASIAETLTVVSEPAPANGRVLEILTGSGGDGAGPFASHGHTVRLIVADPAGSTE